MVSDENTSANANEKLGQIIAEFLTHENQLTDHGRAQILASNPELRDELELFFEQHDWLKKTDGQDETVVRDKSENDTVIEAQLVSTNDDDWVEFGDYQLIRELGRGGMGIVYKARQKSLNRIVAIKMMIAGALHSEEDLIRFQSEAEAAARIRHPNIVAIHEVGQHDGRHFFTMDYVDGPNLKQISDGIPQQPIQSARYIRDIAYAVHELHQHGLVHRDIKPSNILIDKSGKPVLTDFGLAKNLVNQSDLTATGAAIGTPSFMSPEQVRGDKRKIGPLSDVYSLGGVLYALLTGHPPFAAASSFETMQQVLTDPLLPPSKIVASLPNRLEEICLAAMQKEPAGRTPSALALATSLDRFLSNPNKRTTPKWMETRQQLGNILALISTLAITSLLLTVGRIPILGIVAVFAVVTSVAFVWWGFFKGARSSRWSKLLVVSTLVAATIGATVQQVSVLPGWIEGGVQSLADFVSEESQWGKLATNWDPLSPSTDISNLMPKQVANHELEFVDRQADQSDLGIELPGFHAAYKNTDQTTHFFAYSMSKLEKEAVFARVKSAIGDNEFAHQDSEMGLSGSSRSYGEIENWNVDLEGLGGLASFWWDGQWLFMVRSESEAKPFLFSMIKQLNRSIDKNDTGQE